MKSEAPDVTAYIEETPPARQEALRNLRTLCLEVLEGYNESMDYKMPSYKRNNVVEVAFASQRQHICIYILIHHVMEDNMALLQGINHGKGCIRYSNPDKIDYQLIKRLLIQSRQSNSGIC